MALICLSKPCFTAGIFLHEQIVEDWFFSLLMQFYLRKHSEILPNVEFYDLIAQLPKNSPCNWNMSEWALKADFILLDSLMGA